MRRKIVIFASGSGSNAEQISEYFRDSQSVEVVAYFTNSADAGVIERGRRLGIPTVIFGPEGVRNDAVLRMLKNLKINFIVLAGYLKLIPESWVNAFPDKIINIHPALLPKYGGKGMYGMNVHRAVVNSGEKESGITIHFVDSKYDEGKIILQKSVALSESDTPESVQKKVQELEHAFFARTIERVVLS